jgi:fumarate reductase subunit D
MLVTSAIAVWMHKYSRISHSKRFLSSVERWTFYGVITICAGSAFFVVHLFPWGAV